MLQRSLLLALLVLLPRLGRAQAALADTYRQRAETLYAANQYDSATAYYEKAYRLVRTTDPVRAASLCVDLSSMDYMAGHNQTAIDRCQTGLRHLRATRNPPDSAAFKLFSSLGTFYKEIYRADSALIYFRKADALLVRNPLIVRQIPRYVLYHYNNQGNWFFKTGNATRGLVYLTKALELAGQFGRAEDQAYVEGNLAGCYNAQENFTASLAHFVQANTLHPKTDIQQSRNLSGIGWTLYNLHRYPEALRYFSAADRMLIALRRGGKSASHVADHSNLWRMIGTCYRAASRLREADAYLTRGLRLYQHYLGNQGPLPAQFLVEKGLVCEDRHQLMPALRLYQAAIRAICRDGLSTLANPPAETVSDEPTLLLAAWRKAAVQKKLYDTTHNETYLTAAVNTYRYCVGVQERIRHGIDTDQAQVAFTARQHRLVPESIGVVFAAYTRRRSAFLRETLFQLFEQAQAGGLTEALRLSTIRPQTIPPDLLQQEQRLKAQIGDLRQRPASDTVARRALTTRRLAWHQLLDRFQHDFPAYYQLHYQAKGLSSAVLQHQLDGQTAYIAYVRDGGNLFILVATRQTVEVIRQPIDPVRFDRQLATLRQQLYTDPLLARYEGTASAADLYAACMAPLRGYLAGKTRLVIARDWSFIFLPFEVLEPGQQAADYLTRHYAIAYAFSARLFFTHPPVANATAPVLVVAPFVRAGAVPDGSSRQLARRVLPSSEAEARSIGGDLLLGARATLATFRKTDLARPIIYLATHAQTDDTDPANSFIAFYPDTTDKLYTDAIYDMDFSATGLVVLGACAAGSGKTSQGEGILSLARAFAYAGCPAVVTTLWKANDETTSFLTIRLHHHLNQGMPTDQAMQQARQDFFASSLFAKYNHPYYWANYTLVGSHAPVLPGRTLPGLAGLVAIAGLLGLGIFWQRTRLGRLVTPLLPDWVVGYHWRQGRVK